MTHISLKHDDKNELLKASQVAKLIGGNWVRQTVHVYLQRGKFPDPHTYVGNQPLWTREQIIRFKRGMTK